MKTSLKTALFGAALSLGALALSTGAASAYIACDADGNCWHVHDRYTYPDSAGVVIHDDNWAWDDATRYRWREHDGRGYWHGGVWVGF